MSFNIDEKKVIASGCCGCFQGNHFDVDTSKQPNVRNLHQFSHNSFIYSISNVVSHKYTKILVNFSNLEANDMYSNSIFRSLL